LHHAYAITQLLRNRGTDQHHQADILKAIKSRPTHHFIQPYNYFIENALSRYY
jgi:hypothetical protein